MRGVLMLLLLVAAPARAERPIHVAADVIALVREAPALSVDAGVHDALAIRVEVGHDFASEAMGSGSLRGGSFLAIGVPIYLHAAHRGAFLEPGARHERTRYTADCIGPESQPCAVSAPSWSAALVVGWRQPIAPVVVTFAVGAQRTRVPEATHYDRDELVAQLRVGYAF